MEISIINKTKEYKELLNLRCGYITFDMGDSEQSDDETENITDEDCEEESDIYVEPDEELDEESSEETINKSG